MSTALRSPVRIRPALAAPAPRAPYSPGQLADHTRFLAGELLAGSHPWRFDAANRWHQRLYRDDRVDVWLITWLPAQGTQLHDHGGSSGAFTVLQGTLEEASLAGPRTAAHLLRRDRRSGSTVSFGPRYVHDVLNTSAEPAVSVHAYSPPLTSMNFYDLSDLADGGGLTHIAQLATDDPEAPLENAEPLR